MTVLGFFGLVGVAFFEAVLAYQLKFSLIAWHRFRTDREYREFALAHRDELYPVVEGMSEYSHGMRPGRDTIMCVFGLAATGSLFWFFGRPLNRANALVLVVMFAITWYAQTPKAMKSAHDRETQNH